MATQTIILIHGFRGTHDGLALIAQRLKQDGSFKTIVPDLPGFSGGEALDHYDLDSYVEWLNIFIDQQGLNKPPLLLGHSFGSIITATYAARYGKKIKKLILVNPIGAPALEGPRGILSSLAALYYRLGTVLPEKLAHKWLASRAVVDIMSQTMTKTSDKAARAYIKGQHRQYFSLFHSPRSVSESFQTSISNSVRDVAARISTPTLLIAGAQDDITPLAKQKELAQLFPHATLKVIPGVGHLTHYETPHQVASFVEVFSKLP
jgi:pimeloyl-ACP methyl ester carboxylesterase